MTYQHQQFNSLYMTQQEVADFFKIEYKTFANRKRQIIKRYNFPPSLSIPGVRGNLWLAEDVINWAKSTHQVENIK